MIDLALLQLAAPAIESPQPQEARSLYEQGVEARHAGAFSEALALFEARLAEAPDDVDARWRKVPTCTRCTVGTALV